MKRNILTHVLVIKPQIPTVPIKSTHLNADDSKPVPSAPIMKYIRPGSFFQNLWRSFLILQTAQFSNRLP
jgi:hypothetical protein